MADGNGDTLDIVINLATAVVKSSVAIWAGPFGEVFNSMTDLVQAKVTGKLRQRRTERFFQTCVDAVAEKLHDLVQQHGRQVDTTDLAAAINAVRDTFELADLSPAALMEADLDARTLERNMGGARAEVLARALLNEAGERFYGLLLRESCSYAIEFVSTLPSYDVSAFAEILRRDTLILASLQEILDKLPERQSTDDFVADYRRLVIRRLDHMQLFGAKLQSGYGRRYPLSVAYISLGAVPQQPGQLAAPEQWPALREHLSRRVPPAASSALESGTAQRFRAQSELRAAHQRGLLHRDAAGFPVWTGRDSVFIGYGALIGYPDWDDETLPFHPASATGGRLYLYSVRDALEEMGMAAEHVVESHGVPAAGVPDPAVARHGSVAGEVSIEDWLASNDRVLLIGEAGSGKSTLLQWLAVKAARGEFEGDLARWNAHIPFFIPLRRYAADGPPAPDMFPVSVGKNIISVMPQGWVHRCLKDGRGLLLIDGLDELKEGQARDQTLEWLQELIETFPLCSFVVTSRPGAVEGQGELRRSFTPLELRPMTPAKIRGFVEHWHDAMRVELADDEERERLSADQTALLAALETDRYVRALCVNPLLCALICALNRERHGHLPKDRMGVYRGALEMLLDMRDRERGISPALDLSPETKLTLLQDLAFYLVRNAWSDAPVERVREQLARTSRTLNEVTAEPSKVLQFLIERSGLIRTPAEGRVDFIHRSFQEYLAGKAAIDGDDIGYLLQHATDDQFRDVLVMAAGHALPRQAEEFLRGLIAKIAESAKEQAEPARRTHHQLKLLAIACLQAVRRVDPELRRSIEEMAQELLPPESFEVAPVLASIGPLVLDLMADRPPATPAQASASIRVASLVGGRDAMSFIADLAGQFDDIEDEVIRAWTEFDLDEYVNTVVPRLRWSGCLTVTDRTLLPYLASMAGLRELTVPARLIRRTAAAPSVAGASAFPPKPDGLRLLRVTGDTDNLAALHELSGWDDLAQLELPLTRLNVRLNVLQKFRRLECLRIVSNDTATVDLTPAAKLQRLSELHLVLPRTKMIQLSPLSKMKYLTVYVPPGVAILGRASLGGGSKVVISGGAPAA